MKYNEKILSLPPYLSTDWKNVDTLAINENGNLLVILKNKTKIEIPNLSKDEIINIFDAHAKFIETKSNETNSNQISPEKMKLDIPFKIGEGGLESIGSAMQHNPAQSNAPDLPPDVLNKIAAVSKALGIENSEVLPKPEPHCNCFHCQIAKAMQINTKYNEENLEEEVSDDDLKFRDWDIKQIDDKLYEIINPLNEKEKYQVYLGNPIGCTCGQKNCEHLKAVLNS